MGAPALAGAQAGVNSEGTTDPACGHLVRRVAQPEMEPGSAQELAQDSEPSPDPEPPVGCAKEDGAEAAEEASDRDAAPVNAARDAGEEEPKGMGTSETAAQENDAAETATSQVENRGPDADSVGTATVEDNVATQPSTDDLATAAFRKLAVHVIVNNTPLVAIFYGADTDGSNNMDQFEWEEALESMQAPLSPTEAKLAFGVLDADGSGSIEINEFLPMFENIMTQEKDRLMSLPEAERQALLAPPQPVIAEVNPECDDDALRAHIFWR